MEKENKLILYKDDEGKVSVNVRFADEDVWLSQAQLAAIYQTSQENVSMHISNIYTDEELEKEGTYKKFLLVRQEGKRQVQREILNDNHQRTLRKRWLTTDIDFKQNFIFLSPYVRLDNGLYTFRKMR